MYRKYSSLAILLVIAAGCSQEPTASPSQHAASGGTPAQAVTQFLEAVRTGDDRQTAQMLTPKAREEAAKNDLVVAPHGSASATYKIGQTEYVTPEKDGAHVRCSWSDVVDQQGNTRTDEFIWVLRKEPEGWRIAGTVTKVSPDMPPLVLNFEDAADMVRKLTLLQSGAADEPADAQQQVEPQAARSSSNLPTAR